ncbi:protein ACCELERATED CELL DEATH 6 [Quercus suber]|uniref:protein ACCELERATED CELL DEATH 6 n=1 Tax=Quercus suber TaxID=58331 RepID=UPI0032E01750
MEPGYYKAAAKESSTDFVKEILRICPSLLRQANVKGKTPLHIAARYGDAAIVKVLIEHAKRRQQDPKSEVKVTTESALPPELESGVDKAVKKMLKMKNKKKETAMHEAVRNNHLEVVKLLVSNGKDISYSANDAGETPLYMAVERHYREVVFHILQNCKSLTHEGPLGVTTLPAALTREVGMHSIESSSHEDVVNVILKQSSLSNLLNEKDESRDTPLLLSKSLPYIKDLMRHDRVNKMVFNEQNLDAYDIEESSKEKSSEELSKEKFGDNEIAFPHNRPAEFRKFLGEHYIKPKNFLFGLLQWEEEDYKSCRKRFVSVMNKTSQHHMVVDTLIATVTFTAGITMPGGFIQEGPHSGSPVLMRNTAFKAFIITNTIAMVQSCSAAFFHLFMPLLFDEQNPGDFSFLLASLAFFASVSSMGTMMVAFVLGTYAVLMHSWGLAVANSVIGLFYFIPLPFLYHKILSTINGKHFFSRANPNQCLR